MHGLDDPGLDARGGVVEAVGRGPVQDFQAAVEMLDQGRAAFDPIAVVGIKDIADLAHLGVMDVAADDAVEAAAARHLGHRLVP